MAFYDENDNNTKKKKQKQDKRYTLSDVADVPNELIPRGSSAFEIKDILDSDTNAITYDPQYSVAMSNVLIRGKMPMGTRESKIFRLLVSQVQPEDVKFDVFQVSYSTLAEILQIKSVASLRRDIHRITANLLSQSLWIVDNASPKDGKIDWIAIPIVSIAASTGDYIKLQLNDKLEPYLLRLKGSFTQYPVCLLSNFSSATAIRIYELVLMSYGQTRCRKAKFRINLEDLRDILNPNNNGKPYYPDISNFKIRVLDPAVKQINENLLTQFTLSYTTDKNGTGKAQTVIFEVKPRPYWSDPSLATPEEKEAIFKALNIQGQIKDANKSLVTIPHKELNSPMLGFEAVDSDMGSEPSAASVEQFVMQEECMRSIISGYNGNTSEQVAVSEKPKRKVKKQSGEKSDVQIKAGTNSGGSASQMTLFDKPEE